jgi:hypothetical protein
MLRERNQWSYKQAHCQHLSSLPLQVTNTSSYLSIGKVKLVAIVFKTMEEKIDF